MDAHLPDPEPMAAERKTDPRRYFERIGDNRAADSDRKSGVPLSGDHQPLQSSLHHLPPYLRRA